MLVFVPKIRTSNYFSILAEAMPSLLSAPTSSDSIDIPELPTLRKLVLVQNEGSCDADDSPVRTAKDDAIFRRTIDFREILKWSPSLLEAGLLESIKWSLRKDDVINLQFTRLLSHSSYFITIK